MKKVLVLEDEASIRSFIVINLQRAGYEVVEAECGEEALQKLQENPDTKLCLLDIMLPDIDGFEVCRRIRMSNAQVGIIMLTARTQEMDKVTGLMTGADDYVVKPYRPAALLARIDRALARSGSADSARRQLERDGVLLDPVRAEVSYRGKTVELSRNELLVLRILMENAGSIISRSELMDELWQTDAFVDDNTLTVNVNRLRRSLQSAGIPDDFITTRRGLGYVVR